MTFDDVARPATSDEQFSEQYEQLFRQAMRVAYRMTRNAAIAEDVAAEALARAYSRWDAVRRMEQPEGWVCRVAVNLVIDGTRRSKLHRQSLPSVADVEVPHRFDDEIAVRAALVAALATLPKRQRESIALRYLAEFDEDDISRSLRIAPSSVRTHVQRGLAALREQLGPDVEGRLHATR